MKSPAPAQTTSPWKLPRALSVLVAVSALGCAASIHAADTSPLHYIARLGFTDSRHTGPGNSQASRAVGMSDTGFVLGLSHLFVADFPDFPGSHAQTGWVAWPDGRTVRVGTYDALHTRDDGRQECYPLFINRGGVAVGYSRRFSGREDAGTSAWLADRHGTMLKLGFYDAQHTNGDGSKFSQPIALNNRNKLIGYSVRFHPDGISAWVANSVGQINRTGLFDAAHTSPAGYQESMPVAQNDAGYVIGVSKQYVSGTWGTTAWFRDLQKNVHVIGLYSGVHRSATGVHDNQALRLSESGYIVGTAESFSGSAVVGRAVWLGSVSGAATAVGFYDAQVHMPVPGMAFGEIRDLSATGYVVGMSRQYRPGSTHFENDWHGEYTAWLADPQTRATVRVGYYDAAHTNPNGRQSSIAVAVNDHGHVVGTSIVYNSDARLPYNGSDAWIADKTGTSPRIGLYDGLYTRSDGFHRSEPLGITNSGFVWGFSTRHVDSGSFTDRGETAWIYDRTTGNHTKFVFSTRADGYASSQIVNVQEDGSAIGWYRDFDDGTELGVTRGFVYLPGQGTFDVGESLDIDPAQHGWESITGTSFLSLDGYIVGSGRPAGSGSTDVVYSPTGVFLARRN